MRSPSSLALSLLLFGLTLPSIASAQGASPSPSPGPLPGSSLLPPVLVEPVPAVYPDEAKRAGIEGVVALELTIDREGRVSASRVVSPAGHGFDEAAEEAARRFVFRPALRAGKPVVAKIRYTYAFRLEAPLAVAPTPAPARADASEPTTPSTPSPEVEEPPEEINVRGEKEEREAPKRSLDREELRTMPGVNGDPLRAVTSLPGVARAPAFSDVFVVRGSSPAGSAAFLDGSFLPRPFHFGGLASVVPAEMIDRIDFFPGNFAARYGRVDGGLVDIVTRSPAKDRLHALAQVDLLDGRVFAEGPLPGFPGWSFAIGARRSWLDAWLGPVLESGGVGARTAPYYYDGQVFLETHPTARSTVRIGLYTSSDAMNLTLGKIPSGGDPSVSGGLQSQQGFSRMQINYRADWGDRAHASALLSVGSDDGATRVGTVFARSRVDLLTSRGELAYDFARFLTLRGGWDILAATVDLTLRVPRDPRPGQVDPGPLAGQRFVVFDQSGIRAARPGAFFDAVIRPAEALTITPGVRADYTYEVRELTASPRVNARWQTHGGPFATALRGGVGEYRQSIDYNYVASAFGARDLRSSRSIHGSIGVEQSLGDAASITVEGFVKKLDGIVSHDASKGGPDANANGGSGRVVGAELLAKLRPRGRLSGFLSYTLSRSTREDAPGAPTRLFEYDQTHVLTAVGSYRLGRGWSLGGRFRYASGNPFTPCVGGSFAADAGLYGCVTGAPFSARVPAFAQLDVRLDKTWELSEWKLSAYLDVQNATNRENPEGALDKFDKSARTYQAGLPILPILGLRGEL